MGCVLLSDGTYFIRQFLVFVLFIGYRFGEIMCIWYSHVYQNGVLCFLIHECYIRSIKSYCFVRQFAAVPVQLEIVILQYIGWLLLLFISRFLLYSRLAGSQNSAGLTDQKLLIRYSAKNSLTVRMYKVICFLNHNI